MRAWVARDKDNSLYLYNHKPYKTSFFWYKCWDSAYDFFEISETDLPEGIKPQWLDEEPIEVEINITKAKENKQ